MVSANSAGGRHPDSRRRLRRGIGIPAGAAHCLAHVVERRSGPGSGCRHRTAARRGDQPGHDGGQRPRRDRRRLGTRRQLRPCVRRGRQGHRHSDEDGLLQPNRQRDKDIHCHRRAAAGRSGQAWARRPDRQVHRRGPAGRQDHTAANWRACRADCSTTPTHGLPARVFRRPAPTFTPQELLD